MKRKTKKDCTHPHAYRMAGGSTSESGWFYFKAFCRDCDKVVIMRTKIESDKKRPTS